MNFKTILFQWIIFTVEMRERKRERRVKRVHFECGIKVYGSREFTF